MINTSFRDYLRLDGATSSQKRSTDIDNFNTLGNEDNFDDVGGEERVSARSEATKERCGYHGVGEKLVGVSFWRVLKS